MTLDSGAPVITVEARDCEDGCRGRKRRAFRARLAALLHGSGERKRLEVSRTYPVILQDGPDGSFSGGCCSH